MLSTEYIFLHCILFLQIKHTLSQIAYWFDLMLPVEATLAGGNSFNSRFGLAQIIGTGVRIGRNISKRPSDSGESAPSHVLWVKWNVGPQTERRRWNGPTNSSPLGLLWRTSLYSSYCWTKKKKKVYPFAPNYLGAKSLKFLWGLKLSYLFFN